MNQNIIRTLSILYINDNISDTNIDLNTLNACQANIITENNYKMALRLYSKIRPDIIITDIKVGNKSGFKFSKKIREMNPYQPIIIKTMKNKKKHMLKALDIQIDSYLVAATTKNTFIKKIEYVGKKYLNRKKNIEKRMFLQSILDNQSGFVLVTDFDSLSYCSKSFLDFFAFSSIDELFNRYESILDMFIKHDSYLHGNTKDEILEKFKNSKAIKKVVLLVGKSFTPKAFHIDIDIIDNAKKELFIVSLTNISIMQEKNIEISYKAYIDGLTGISNRNKFEEVFDYEIKRNERYEENLCVCVLDIDHFKKFNDTYGHLIGDEVLVKIANEVNNNIRKTDLFARWGGEEFVLLMPETNLDEARVLCEKLRKLIENTHHSIAGKITCSFGITSLIEEDTLTTIFKRCDKALYKAKDNGRNRVETLV